MASNVVPDNVPNINVYITEEWPQYPVNNPYNTHFRGPCNTETEKDIFFK